MKRKSFALFAGLFLAVSALVAQNVQIGMPIPIRKLPACTYQRVGVAYHIYDGTTDADCTTGGAATPVLCSCNGSGTWVSFNSINSGISYTGQILIAAAGAGNDVTLTAADDIILTSTDDTTINPTGLVNITPGESFAVTTTAGNVTLTAGGTTQDASIISTDDIFLTPDDALVAIAGGATTITSTTGTVAIAASAGAVTVNAVGATNDITLTAADDVILAPTDALTGTVGGAIGLTTTAGNIGLTAGGTTQDITLTSVDDVILAPTGDLTGTVGAAVGITTTAGNIGFTVGGTTQDFTVSSVDDATFTITDDVVFTVQDFLPSASATAVIVAPATTITASTSVLMTTPIASVSGVIERKVTDVTVADDAGGTKPTGAIPITTDYATCTCNDATGCTMSVAEPTVTVGYGRALTIVSTGTGNCEFADSAGVLELSAALVMEPTSTLSLMYANAAWHEVARVDNVP